MAVPTGWKFGVDKLFDMSGLTSGAANAPDANAPVNPNNPPMSAEEKKMMDDIAKGINEFSKEEEEAHLDRLRKNGIILMCVSTGKVVLDEDRTRFYVKKESQNTNWTWEDAAAAQKDKFNGKVTPKMVTLPVGQAYRMEQTWQMANGAMHTVVAYAIPSGRDLYSLRFITEEPKEVVTNIDKQVAESFRIN